MTEPTVVPDLLRARVAEAAAAVALRVGDAEALTYGDWDARSAAVAAGLVERGVRPGDRVGLVFPNARWADVAVCWLGVLRAGAVAVPLGDRFAGPELAGVLDHAGAVGTLGPAAVGGGPWWSATPSELEATGAGRAAPDAPVGPHDLAEVVYTSGTTGVPKGVACTHANLLAHDLPPEGAAPPGTTVSFLHAFPVGTQAGQEALRVPLRVAGRVAGVLPAFDAAELCGLVERHRVMRLQLVPAMAQVLVASGEAGRHDVSSVRRVILSSSPAAPALFARLAEAFPGATLWNAYALTEAGAARTLVAWDERRPTAVGRPVGETEVRVAGPSGDEVPPGATGEVWLRRRGTPTRWYFRDPEATARVFVDGWVRTGDLGRLDPDGVLHLVGRSKDLIISGGSNVSPVEVENVLFEHPAVTDAAVFGVPHPVLGEDVAAAVVLRSPAPVRELQDLVRSRLAEHKVPHRVVVVDRLPRNPGGKVAKDELRAAFPAAAGSAGGAGAGAARTATEAVVASVWAAVLEQAEVGADDDFFALGGHSLAAAQIAARLADAFGVDLGAAAVFEAPTVAELSEAVDEARRAQGAPQPVRSGRPSEDERTETP